MNEKKWSVDIVIDEHDSEDTETGPGRRLVCEPATPRHWWVPGSLVAARRTPPYRNR
ncbi:hypothetical protein SAMN04490220_2037 [Rhodococcus jostii]|uniref:Uncharacterized protein n=1 Tax=Rhodococcus jostii TaxID=132919 RepID=A0A1H4TQP7_RHOJO|nr:hypothetical protein SAMN04490220_2037 [Rhodococcus jostii]